MARRKVLIIGIDGGTWKLLKPAMDKGYMPYLKSLVEEGASGILESTKPAITPAAWGSFQTGVNPGKNGVFDFVIWDKKQKKPKLVNSSFLQKTIWEIASAAGKRVGVVNVPMTYPPRPVNGYMVTGILTPSLDSNFTYPPKLKFELFKVVPNYHIFNLENIKEGSPHEQFESFVQKMVAVIENRTKAAQFIINKEPLDIFMVHFQATDVIQHVMWGYLDKCHPLYDPVKCNYIFDYFYRQLDQKIREIRLSFEKKVQEDYLTFIISDHGFQTHKKRFNLGNWLYQKGFLKLNPKFFQRPRFIKLIQRLDILNLRKRFFSQNLRSKVVKSLKQDIEPFVWNRSRAFSIGNSGEGFIYLLEEEKAKQEATAVQLIEELSLLKDPEDGTFIVSRVYHKEEIYSGKYLDLMPDLLIEPTDGYSFTGYYQSKAELFHKVNPQDDFHIGKHHKDGIFIAVGETIKRQKHLQAQLIDIAPTILYYLGLPIPKEIDGCVLTKLFTKNFLEKHPIEKISSIETPFGQEEKMVYSSDDEQKLKERLKNLGYL